jgi:hypothetical protein
MFKENKNYLQNELFTFIDELPISKQKKIRQSPEAFFYTLAFQKIDEKKFERLYSEKGSRPNAPINAMVSALILKEKSDWSYAELFDNISFNLLTKVALGLRTISEEPFCYTTIFNFQKLVLKHYLDTGEHLIENVFDDLTKDQIDKLQIKTSIQRTDSFLAGSNVRRYGRLQLLVEVIIRLYRILSDEDKSLFKERFAPYVKDTSSQYIYHLKPSEITHEMTKIGEFYYLLIEHFKDNYPTFVEYKTLARVFSEHFVCEEEKIKIIPNEQLSSNNIQSPDDLDATYRNKDGEKSIGQSINISETAHPDNEINLVTDIAQTANNVNDSIVLNERLDILKRYMMADQNRCAQIMAKYGVKPAKTARMNLFLYILQKLCANYVSFAH